MHSYNELTELIGKGLANRAESSNLINQLSSRSHAILTLEIVGCENGRAIKTKLMVVDLAGSERNQGYGKIGKQTVLTIKEGANINRSLLSFGNCIKSIEAGDKHIPYRDSKLTRILKDSLSRQSHNILIACVSQSHSQFDENISTLQYAMKACKIKQTSRSLLKTAGLTNLEIDCQHCQMGLNYVYLDKQLSKIGLSIISME